MTSSAIQLLVLAAVAVFLILKLRSVLGTREGFEQPPIAESSARRDRDDRFEVVEGGADRDVTDHVDQDSPAADALRAMKSVEPNFMVGEFLQGAKGAYEMILMGFERGDLDGIKDFLSTEVFETFVEVVAAREDQGLTIEADFVGVRETSLLDATYDEASGEGEIKVRFVGELTSVVRDKGGDIVEGSPTDVKRVKDSWTFARKMGANNPNWQLVATGE